MALLLFLYFLQGIPIGLSSAVPMLLASRGASFSDQALFSLAPWPYSLKLLWAPVVDALWTQSWRLGQRKSWIVPIQLATGAVMITLAARMDDLFGPGGPEGGKEAGGGPNVAGLTAAFFALYLLVATQDIAVDAWALTMLRPENVGHASTANAVGQSAGILTAFSVFLALESPSVSDDYVRPALGLPKTGRGLVTMAGFLTAWGCVFILATLCLWAFKVEAPPQASPQRGSPEMAAPLGQGAHEATVQPAGRPRGSARSSSRSGRTTARSNSRSPPAITNRRMGATASIATARSGAAEEEVAPLVSVADGDVELAEVGAGEGAGAEPAPLRAKRGGTSTAERSASPPQHGLSAALSALRSSYADFASLLRLPPIILLAALTVTSKVGWQATDRASGLVMQQRGWPKETLAAIDVASSLLQLGLQIFVLARLAARTGPLQLYRSLYPLRVLGCIATLAIVYLLPVGLHGSVPSSSIAVVFVVSNLCGAVSSLQFMSQMAFYSRVAAGDPGMGGTAMTLLNTLSNIASALPGPLVLKGIDLATAKGCVAPGAGGWWPSSAVRGLDGVGTCSSSAEAAACAAAGEGYVCATVVDGYAIAVAVSVVYSLAWWASSRQAVVKLSGLSPAAWTVPGRGAPLPGRAALTPA